MKLSAAGVRKLFYESAVAIVAAQDVAGCESVFAKAVAKFGVDVFACGEVSLSTPTRTVMHVVHWPQSWRDFYLRSGLVGRDPLLDNLRHRRTPFTWSDMREDRTISAMGTEALRVIAAHGWTEGLAVPIPRSADQVGLVSLVGRRAPFLPPERDFLCTLSVLFHERVRVLAAAKQAVAVPPVGMTKREIATLNLVARGGTDADVAGELNISPATAHEFVEKAKGRLGASTRTQAVALAVALGLFSV